MLEIVCSVVMLSDTAVPCTIFDASFISPPISSHSAFAMVKPNLAPPYFRAIEGFACTNQLKTISCSSGSIPIPVSETERYSCP